MKLLQTTLLIAAVGLTTSITASAQTEDSLDKLPKPVSQKVDASALLASPTLVSRIIIHFTEGDVRSRDAAALDRTLNAASRASGQQLRYVRTLGEGGVLVEIQDPNAASKNMDLENQVGPGLPHATVLNVMETLAMDPGVMVIEPEGWARMAFKPNDALYESMWHLGAFPGTNGINVEPAWDRARGHGIRIAVLDTGIVSHPDLDGNVIAGWDMVSDRSIARDGDGRDSDPADEGDWTEFGICGRFTPSSWHGTHVSGTIAATANNSAGIAGVAFGARIMPVRVLGAAGLSGLCSGGLMSDIADAISWASGGENVPGATPLATNARAHILNLSLGGFGFCPTAIQNAINAATDRGSTVIVATYNTDLNTVTSWPSNCQNVVVVTASNQAGKKANGFGFGRLVDVAAPGEGVGSTINLGKRRPEGPGYDWWDGTSMAVPHVSGVAALLLSRCSRTPAGVEAALKTGVRTFTAPCQHGANMCGTGIIDADKVLDQCNDGNFYVNDADYSVPDNGQVTSPIRVQGRSGVAPSALQVRVWVNHPNVGHLKVELIAPGGQVFLLHNRTGNYWTLSSAYTINASASPASGTWNLRVTDAVSGSVGSINTWSLQF